MKEGLSRPAHSTLAELGLDRLTALARRVGLSREVGNMRELFCELLSPWGERDRAEPPAWPSDVCDDHTPFEFSFVMGGRTPELRILVESRDNPPSLRSNQRWGLAVNAMLEKRYGVSLERFERLRDLFLPEQPEGAFAIWHAVSFFPGEAPKFKLYLNLAAQGTARAEDLTRETLARLSLGEAWPHLAEHCLGRGPALDALMYLSLDLAEGPDARVKVYLRHYSATCNVLERSCGAAPSPPPGSVREFCRALAGDEGPYERKAPVVCLTYGPPESRPSASTCYFPVAAYAPNDRVARDRVAAYLEAHDLSASEYLGGLEAFATRGLQDGVGMQSYASLRIAGGRPRVTVYLSPEAYRTEPARS
jgi:DMATS type aromatic prenyltransferase